MCGDEVVVVSLWWYWLNDVRNCRGRHGDALQYVLNSAPVTSKNQAVKVLCLPSINSISLATSQKQLLEGIAVYTTDYTKLSSLYLVSKTNMVLLNCYSQSQKLQQQCGAPSLKGTQTLCSLFSSYDWHCVMSDCMAFLIHLITQFHRVLCTSRVLMFVILFTECFW